MLMAASAAPCLTALHRAALRGDLTETRALLAAVSAQGCLVLTPVRQRGLATAAWAASRGRPACSLRERVCQDRIEARVLLFAWPYQALAHSAEPAGQKGTPLCCMSCVAPLCGNLLSCFLSGGCTSCAICVMLNL